MRGAGNLEADIQLGVGSGFSLLWWTACCCMIFVSDSFAAALQGAASSTVTPSAELRQCVPVCLQGFCYQCLSGRIGLVTGKDLAQHIGARCVCVCVCVCVCMSLPDPYPPLQGQTPPQESSVNKQVLCVCLVNL